MNHPGDLLSAYLDGELSPEDRVGVDAHLAGCGDCRDELGGIAGARAAVRALPMLEPPPGLMPTPAATALRRYPRHRLAWAAAAVAASLLGIGLLTGSEGAPAFDLDTLNDRHTVRVVVDPGISTLRGSVGVP